MPKPSQNVMSLMSPKTATILSPEKRRDVIRENILNCDYKEIAVLCHCTERTIKRDVRIWKREGGFEEFLLDEFLRSYPEMKKGFPEKAFDRLCYLLGKTLTHKIEAKTETTSKHVEEKRNVTILADYTKAIESAVNRDLEAIRARKQVDSSRAHTETS